MAPTNSDMRAEDRTVTHNEKVTKLGARYSPSPPSSQKKRKIIEDVSNGKANEHNTDSSSAAGSVDDEDDSSTSESSSEEDSDGDSDSDDDGGINTAALIELLTAQAAQADSAHQENHTIDESSLQIPGRAPQKPDMKSFPRPGLSIRDRVAAFLPELAAANQELEELRRNGELDDKIIDDYTNNDGNGGGRYIEMDLGLGVLEEKNADAPVSDRESEPENDDGVMDNLMGRKSKRENDAATAGIEEV